MVLAIVANCADVNDRNKVIWSALRGDGKALAVALGQHQQRLLCPRVRADVLLDQAQHIEPIGRLVPVAVVDCHTVGQVWPTLH